jgi:hypothetical protein
MKKFFAVASCCVLALASGVFASDNWTAVKLSLVPGASLGGDLSVRGLDLGLMATGSPGVRGLQIAPIYTEVSETSYGAQLMFAGKCGDLRGVQYGFVAFGDIIRGEQMGLLFAKAKTVYGDQEGIYATCELMYGSQGALIADCRRVYGVQEGLLTIADKIDGGQGGLINYAPELKGIQLGLLNITSEAYGVQLGLINVSQTLKGVQFGLINVISRSNLPAMVLINVGM